MTLSTRALTGLGLCVLAATASADTITIAPSQDNSMYSESGAESNGVGDHIFVGATAVGPDFRRALIQFDVPNSIPAGATITSVVLTLNMSNTIAGAEDVDLHKLTASWGEGTSNAPGMEGQGGTASVGDATWTDRFYPATSWTTPGGDFDPTPSATTSVDSNAYYTWGSTAAMVADVQDWLDNPANNNGWILIGNESTNPTAKRFDSRENPTPADRPTLTIDFDIPSFCDAADGSHALCPCDGVAPAPNADAGCQIAQLTGGVGAQLAGYNLVTNQGTIVGTGFPPASSPTAIVIRANNQEAVPVAFGDGLRCSGTVNLVRLAATVASGGSSVHAFGHNPALPPATFYYQIWFRNTPATGPCSAAPAAFNLSNGRAIFWP